MVMSSMRKLVSWRPSPATLIAAGLVMTSVSWGFVALVGLAPSAPASSANWAGYAMFDGENYRTAPTGGLFTYLQEIEAKNVKVASPTGIEPVLPP